MQFPQQMIPSYNSICVPLRRLIFFSLSLYIYIYFFLLTPLFACYPLGWSFPIPSPPLRAPKGDKAFYFLSQASHLKFSVFRS